MSFYRVALIHRDMCAPYIIGIHYAKRWPSISYAYGLFRDDLLCGVVTYGKPASSPLRCGIAGDEFQEFVIELNRLCLKDNLKNEASMLVSRSLSKLPKPKIVVSFADTSQGHLGTVYQACNFVYCGLSEKRTDWKVKGKEHLHGQTIADEFRGHNNRSQLMREKYGEDFYLCDRPRKHRYLYLIGDKSWKKNVMSRIRYQTKPYPKTLVMEATA